MTEYNVLGFNIVVENYESMHDVLERMVHIDEGEEYDASSMEEQSRRINAAKAARRVVASIGKDTPTS